MLNAKIIQVIELKTNDVLYPPTGVQQRFFLTDGTEVFIYNANQLQDRDKMVMQRTYTKIEHYLDNRQRCLDKEIEEEKYKIFYQGGTREINLLLDTLHKWGKK